MKVIAIAPAGASLTPLWFVAHPPLIVFVSAGVLLAGAVRWVASR